MNDIMKKINGFTRRELSEDEVYIFDVILCDNDIDRDCERFSDSALEQLKSLFIGKTGIFDHDPSSSKQNARIFDAKLITDNSRTTKNGEPYRCLRASCYMVRTNENSSLIAEIDGGIKKEVSISCSASKRICSVCGCDKSQSSCAHVKGKSYNGKTCHTVLDGITDAYEWSFVAVPAQVNAGVTKKFSCSCADSPLRNDIRRLAFFAGGKEFAEKIDAESANMSVNELMELKKSFEKSVSSEHGTNLQLSEDTNEDYNCFSMK